jgi:signal transduction histidine kinase
MRQRTAAVGGMMHIDSSGEGTVVHIEIPRLARASAGD